MRGVKSEIHCMESRESTEFDGIQDSFRGNPWVSNSESIIRESGIRNPESGIRIPESGIWNLESEGHIDSHRAIL